ncbi:porphobilinogen deaminase [Catalinimonas alkaloidigena]|nr:porphobilinogen deaminase [Catalinimonas alkaloidigena]
MDEGAEIWEVMSNGDEVLRAKLIDVGGELKFVKQ